MVMAEKEYICAYPNCLHHGEKVSASESVVIGNKHYHWDCAALKQEIQDCASTYVEYVNDKTLYPTTMRILNTMVFKNKVPIDFIKKKIESSKLYYKNKPVYALYGIRKIFWGKEMNL